MRNRNPKNHSHKKQKDLSVSYDYKRTEETEIEIEREIKKVWGKERERPEHSFYTTLLGDETPRVALINRINAIYAII